MTATRALSPSELIASVRISNAFVWLGGRPPRHGRGAAFWRGGDGPNVSLNDVKNCWWDHVAGEGGGVLDLVVRVRGGDRRAALQWLSGVTGIPLRDSSPEQRRQYARLAPQAARLAQDMADYWTALRTELEQRREDLKMRARLALESDNDVLYKHLDQLCEPIRTAIAKIDKADPEYLARMYAAAMRADHRRVDELRRAGGLTRKDDERLTWELVAALANRGRTETE